MLDMPLSRPREIRQHGLIPFNNTIPGGNAPSNDVSASGSKALVGL
jgi:hypothetical protein